MTKYQVPSQPLESSNTPTGDNFQSELNSDWESRIAKLVGLEEEESQPTEEDSANFKQPTSEPQEPREVQTEQPLSSNPFAKLALVGAGTLTMVLFAGIFLTQIMSGGNKRNTPIRNNAVIPQPKPETLQQQQQEQIEALKTKLALAEQAQAVKAAQQQLRTAKLTPSPEVAVKPTPRVEPPSTNRPTVVVQRIPTPARTVYVPQRVTVERIVRVPQRVATRTPLPRIPQNQPTFVPPPVTPPVATPSTPPVQITPPPTPPNPLQEWSRLAKLGSYGQVSGNGKNANNTVIAQAQNIPAPRPLITPRPPVRIQYQPSPITRRNSKSTVVGSSAKGVLATAISGETTTTNNNNKSSDRDKSVFVVQLKEPLKAADGTVAVPAKAELLTQVSSISEGGLVQLNVVKVVLRENGDRIERSVPQDALVVRGSGGKPLLASQYSGQGSSLGNDAMLFVLGGVGKAAELPNRSRSRLVPITSSVQTPDPNNPGKNITTTTTTTVVQNDTNENIAAGALEGGVRAVVPEMTRRNQMANSRNMQRNNVWYLPKGKEVELFVNQEMQF